MYPYECCTETSDKTVLVYKRYVSNTILFRSIGKKPFLQILSNIHFTNDADDDGTDRLFKIWHVVETMISNFRETFIPYQKITAEVSWQTRFQTI